jgi:hypothetical protein
MIYSLLECSRAKYLDLEEARTVRKAAAVLCPLQDTDAAAAAGAGAAVDATAITQANMAVARNVAKQMQKASTDQVSVCDFLLYYHHIYL